MKLKKHFLKIISFVLTAVMAVSSAGITAMAVGETPVGYIVSAPGEYSPGADVQSSADYIAYKNLLENKSDVISAVYNAVLSMQESINMSGYDLTLSEMPALISVFYYSFPELWYLNGFQYSYYSNNKIAYIYPLYLSENDIPGKTQEFFDVAAQRYLPLVDDSMDDFTKAVILHDALALNSYYPVDYQTNSGNNYTFMVQNYGVCQYYSECYAYLLAQCGIKSEVINSDQMNHAWLKILLDRNYYNVDLTWDDPVADRVGMASHLYFLLSDSAFQQNYGHYGYASINSADSVFYDGFDNLHSFNTQLCYLDGTFYAIKPETFGGELVQYDHTNDAVTVKKSLDFYWPAESDGYYWTGCYSSLAEYGGKLYYNSPSKVYEYDPATGDTNVFAEGEGDKSLYGLRIIDGTLWGVYADSPNDGYVDPTYMRDMPEPTYTVTIDSDILHGTVEADKYTAAEGETVTLTVVPDDGYNVNSVLVNNELLIPEDGVYSFEMPATNVTVSAEFSFADGMGARVVGHSLSVEGDIGVNFYMELDENVAASETAYMRFLIPGTNGVEESDIAVSNAKTKTAGNHTYYIFKCGVSAKEMSSTITAQLIDGDHSGDIYTYSVKDYAEYVLARPEVSEYAAAANIVKAMLNYGAYSQLYFGKTGVPLANESLTTAEQQPADVTAATIGKSTYTASLPDGVVFEGATLSLKSNTTLSLYFTSANNAELSFACSGKTVDKSSVQGYQVARLRGIPSFELDNEFTVSVTANGSTGTISYSPMNYCYNALNNSDTEEKLTNVIKALYVYWNEAYQYFNSHSPASADA